MVEKKQAKDAKAEQRPELPLEGSQLAVLGEGSAVVPVGMSGGLVSDDGYEFSITERLYLLEGGNPAYGHHV